MAEEMAELAATGSPTAEGPVSRQDSAHEMAQGESLYISVTNRGDRLGMDGGD